MDLSPDDKNKHFNQDTRKCLQATDRSKHVCCTGLVLLTINNHQQICPFMSGIIFSFHYDQIKQISNLKFKFAVKFVQL